MMDALADVLSDLRLASSFYARSELSAPWGLAFSVKDGPSFHAVLTGRCWLCIGEDNISLEAGDLALLPHGDEHRLAAGHGATSVPLSALPSERVGQNASILRFGGNGEHSLLICGGVRFAGPIAHPLLELLPRVVLLKRQEQESAWLGATLTLLGEEALSLRPGSAAVMTRLADILVLQAIRAWLECDASHRPGWIGALGDPAIGHALALIHRHAEERWTLASLAAEVHLSRSIFSDRFSQLVGMSPMQYVARWRMHLAGSWIREGQLSLSEITHRLGYSSEAAFSRAFKRHLHVSPGSLRRDL
jgi:AraC-like DNA-binding protein